MKKSIKKGIGVIASAVLAFSMMPAVGVHAAGAISMDGDTSDWGQVTSQSVNGGSLVDDWKVAQDNDNVYIMYTGNLQNADQYGWSGGSNLITINGSSKSENIQVVYDGNGISVKNSGWQDLSDIGSGFEMKANRDYGSGNTSGPYIVELAIPKSLYGGTVNVGFAGSYVSAASIPGVGGEEAPAQESSAEQSAAPAEQQESVTPAEPQQQESVTPAEPQQPAQTTYTGISVDGDFRDWDAVAKVTPSDDRVREVASVWDGDYLYIYAKSGDWGSITWSGVNNNGKFAIVSDLGYTELIQFKKDGTVEGPAGTTYHVNGDQWEVAIPKSSLPNYKKSLNVGFYLGDTIVGDIQNLDGSTNENITPGEMALDGSYSEWDQYPHTVIQYNTAGTNEMVVDAQGAMYMDGDKIYGHVVTNMPEHLQKAGGEFNYAVMMFNSANPANDYGNPQQFGWKLFSLDPSGNVHWEDSNNLSQGTHRYYVTSVQSWGNNINDENKNLPIFGEIIMTIGQGNKDDMEFCMNTNEIANYFNVSPGDLRIASIYYTEIGKEWVTNAGTSSGPVLGVIISMTVAGVAFIFKRRRMDGTVGCVEA